MKTSPSQFEMLVTYMEQHGDLCKIATLTPRGRITTLQKWEELVAVLNSDGAGATKSTEKWKKVWSDIKGNTKKKAARLHRAASGTGGGPATLEKLSHLESRILNLMGTQVATGLAVEEAGLLQDFAIPPVPTIIYDKDEEESQSTPPPTPSFARAISSPRHMFIEQGIQRSQPNRRSESGPSTSRAAPHRSFVEDCVGETGLLSPTRPSYQSRVVRQPSPLVQNTRARRTKGSPRRQARVPHSEQAAQHFLQADASWRVFKEKQHKEKMDMNREYNRIRLMELQAQSEWRAIENNRDESTPRSRGQGFARQQAPDFTAREANHR